MISLLFVIQLHLKQRQHIITLFIRYDLMAQSGKHALHRLKVQSSSCDLRGSDVFTVEGIEPCSFTEGIVNALSGISLGFLNGLISLSLRLWDDLVIFRPGLV